MYFVMPFCCLKYLAWQSNVSTADAAALVLSLLHAYICEEERKRKINRQISGEKFLIFLA